MTDHFWTAVDQHAATKTPTLQLAGDPTGDAAPAIEGIIRNLLTAPEGERNHRLNWAAYTVGGYIAAGHTTEADTRDRLIGAALAIGLTASEATATVTSGLRSGAQHPRHPTATGTHDAPDIPAFTVPEGADPSDHGAAVRAHLPLIDWHELWTRPVEDEDWIIYPLLPARRLIAIYSAPKVGKSLLMLELAAAIASGTRVLGTRPKKMRVLYVDFENDPQADVKTRLVAMGYTPEQLADLCYLSFPTLAALDSPRGGDELMAAVTEYECGLVVIDTVSRAVKGDENENDTWLNFYRHCGLKLKQAGVALVRLDHAGKDLAKGQRGGSAKSGDVDAVWRLVALEDGKTLTLKCEAHRFPLDEMAANYTLTRHNQPLRHDVSGAAWTAEKAAKTAGLIATMDRLGIPDNYGRDLSSKALKAAGEHASERTLNDAIKVRKLRFAPPDRDEEMS